MAVTSVKVYPVAIQSMFVPGGQVHAFGRQLRRDVMFATRRAAPKRSGVLRRSIRADRVGTNQYGVRVNVKAWAPHAKWVNDGTTGPIFPSSSRALVLYAFPPLRTGIPGRYQRFQGAHKESVDGQRGQHFMAKGMTAGLAKNRLR